MRNALLAELLRRLFCADRARGGIAAGRSGSKGRPVANALPKCGTTLLPQAHVVVLARALVRSGRRIKCAEVTERYIQPVKKHFGELYRCIVTER